MVNWWIWWPLGWRSATAVFKRVPCWDNRLLKQWRRCAEKGEVFWIKPWNYSPCLQLLTPFFFFLINCQRRLIITSSRQIWTHSLLCLLRLTGSLLDVIAQVPLNGRSTHLVTSGDSLSKVTEELNSWVEPNSPLRTDVTDSPTVRSLPGKIPTMPYH